MAEQQKTQIKSYFAACQPVFERIYTELAIRQPDRPWMFLSEAFLKLSQSEKDEWLRTLNVKPGTKPQQDDKSPDAVAAAADEVHITWKLTLKESKDKSGRSTLLSALNDIRSQAILAPDCVRFDLLSNGANQIVVAHSWSTAAAFERFNGSPNLKKHEATIASLVSANTTDKYQRL